MKNLIIFIVIFFIIDLNKVFSQPSYISRPVQLTNGNNDRNPSFGKKESRYNFSAYDKEFLIFERGTGNSTQVCITMINYDGHTDNPVYLTNDTYQNRNPIVSYNQHTTFETTPKYALAVWQSDKFGRNSIFASRYERSSGWSSPIIIDSSSGNKETPDVLAIDTINYLITYKSGNDIVYKKYNSFLNSFPVERNLTQAAGGIHKNPKITSFLDQFIIYKIAISFEKEISASQQAIYYRAGFADSIPIMGTPADTIAFSGYNINEGFFVINIAKQNVFSSNRNSGTYSIYSSTFGNQNNLQAPVISNQSFSSINYSGTDYPITDVSPETNSAISMLSAHNRKSADLKLAVKIFWYADSSIINISSNPEYKTKNTISSAIQLPGAPFQRYWIAYNKDSISPDYPSRIFAVNFTNGLSGMNSNSTSVADAFILYQNYPNPFNPKTVIGYQLSINSLTKLKVYDVLGNEVATLINQRQDAGSYKIEFDGSNFPSGVYFYKIEVGNFSEVKKMTLLK